MFIEFGVQPTALGHAGLLVVAGALHHHHELALALVLVSFHLRQQAGQVTVERYEDRALAALQGPEAAAVLAAHAPEVAQMVFMDIRWVKAFGEDLIVSRSGYTGEDGYEISIPGHAATSVWNTLLADARVRPIGLGARDSLRLEAGLPLYGHDLDESVSPIEGDLAFAIARRRREASASSSTRWAAAVDRRSSQHRMGSAVNLAR